MAKTQIIVAVNGNKQTTDQLLSEEFNIAKKLEYEFSGMTADDGYTDLNVSKLRPISKILIQSDNTVKLKIDHLSGIVENYISGVTYISLDPIYAANISGIAIATTSINAIDGFISLLKLA
jgi:hypothetical protein